MTAGDLLVVAELALTWSGPADQELALERDLRAARVAREHAQRFTGHCRSSYGGVHSPGGSSAVLLLLCCWLLVLVLRARAPRSRRSPLQRRPRCARTRARRAVLRAGRRTPSPPPRRRLARAPAGAAVLLRGGPSSSSARPPPQPRPGTRQAPARTTSCSAGFFLWHEREQALRRLAPITNFATSRTCRRGAYEHPHYAPDAGRSSSTLDLHRVSRLERRLKPFLGSRTAALHPDQYPRCTSLILSLLVIVRSL